MDILEVLRTIEMKYRGCPLGPDSLRVDHIAARARHEIEKLKEKLAPYEDLGTVEELREKLKEKTCTYSLADDDFNAYECSECGQWWCLTDGTPEDNEINYCQGCGTRIVEQAAQAAMEGKGNE